jgi:hypothetical protein
MSPEELQPDAREAPAASSSQLKADLAHSSSLGPGGTQQVELKVTQQEAAPIEVKNLAGSPAKVRRVLLMTEEVTLGAGVEQENSMGPTALNNKKAGEEMSSEVEPKIKKEIVELTTKADEYYDSCRKWAQAWMILFIGCLLLALFLVLGLILIWTINVEGELIAQQSLTGKIITRWNVTVLMITLLAANILIVFAARFNRRWRLYHSTLQKLAELRIDLSNSTPTVEDWRTKLINAINAHNEELRKQAIFKGPRSG